MMRPSDVGRERMPFFNMAGWASPAVMGPWAPIPRFRSAFWGVGRDLPNMLHMTK